MKRAVSFLTVFLAAAVPCAGEIIIVDDGGYGDFDNIQAAINNSNDGDIIYVLPGTYTGAGNYNIDYGGRAITVTGVEPEDPYIVAATVIDCEGAGRGFDFHSVEGPNSVLAGLTVTNGYATSGGGIYCFNASPVITNCLITNCTATTDGGGMYVSQLPYPYPSHAIVANCKVVGNEAVYGGGVYLSNGALSNCVLSENLATLSGGGIYCSADSNVTIGSCSIADNEASVSGGGVYCANGKVTDCLVQGNRALGEYSSEGGGGGLFMSGSGTVSECVIRGNSANFGFGGGVDCIGYLRGMVRNCEISNNSAAYGGGVSWCHVVANCVIAGNTAGFFRDGGGLYCCDKVINCEVTGNVAGDMGGGLYSFEFVSQIVNCTFSGNVADSGGAVAGSPHIAGGFVLSDNILWANRSNLPDTNEIDLGVGYIISANYNCIRDGSWVEGVGNIVEDPMFVREPNDGGDGWGDDPCTGDVNEGDNDDYGDLHLTAGSPCINTADPCLYIGVDYGDIDGQPRIMGFRADMGADEFVIPMITVTKPEGGEVWARGSVHDLAWANCVYEGDVDILLSVDDGNNWQGVEGNVPNTESYVWEVPVEVDSNRCVIAVVPSAADPNVICIESGVFTIHPDSPGPVVTSKWKTLGGDYDRKGLSVNYGPELGCVKWTFATGGPIAGSVTIGAYDRVHVPCEDGKVYTLDANGAVLWSYDTNSAVLSAPSVGPDGSIYVGTESGRLYALDLQGNARWTHDADGFIYSSPGVSPDGNSIYVCSSDGVVCALGRDGSVLWTFQTVDRVGIGSSILASPAVGPDGTVYVAAVRDPNLYALDPNDGSVKWACNLEVVFSPVGPSETTRIPYSGWATASPVVGPDGTIYQALLYDPNLYAVDGNTGDILWSVRRAEFGPYGDSGGWAEPAVGPDGTIYFGSSDANLWAVEPNGAVAWVRRLGLTIGVTLTVGSNGLIYAADNDGWLCVVAANGNELSRFYSGGWLHSPVVSADNTVIISDVNNVVWVLGGDGCGDGPFALHRPEDLDGSGLVSLRDFALLAGDWLESKNPYFPEPYPWPPYDWDGTYFVGDVDRNLDVDFADLAAMANRWLSGD